VNVSLISCLSELSVAEEFAGYLPGGISSHPSPEDLQVSPPAFRECSCNVMVCVCGWLKPDVVG